MPRGLTPKRRQCLEFIVSSGRVPTRKEIADHMGWQWASSANDVLNWLRHQGYVSKLGYAGWVITDKGRKAVEQKDEAA